MPKWKVLVNPLAGRTPVSVATVRDVLAALCPQGWRRSKLRGGPRNDHARSSNGWSEAPPLVWPSGT